MKNTRDQILRSGELVLAFPCGASCGLYYDVPSSTQYFDAIDIKNAIKPFRIEACEGITLNYYNNLEVGTYHYGASMDGYTAVCQVVNLTEEKLKFGKRIDVSLLPLAKNGYERGYIMMNSEDFIKEFLASEKDTWGKEYARLFRTPQFSRSEDIPGRHMQTTNEEMWEFINSLHEKSKHMYVYSLGKSPKYSYDMPLVIFTLEDLSGKSLTEAAEILKKNKKPTVQYTAQIHSNEPASTEGALSMMLMLNEEYGNEILPKTDVYIIPRINLDGAVEFIRQAPTTMEDMNRDYLYMNNKEIRMVTSAYNLFLPEFVIDGHEKLSNVTTSTEARCTDMEVQIGTGALNHPKSMTDAAMEIAFVAINKGRSLGLRTHFFDNLAAGAGGSAGSSYFGTRNSISFLVETPGGTTLGGLCMARRVLGQYTLASSVISYAAENAERVMNIVHSSRDEMATKGHIYDESRMMVIEHGKVSMGILETPFIDVPKGKLIDPARKVEYFEHAEALRTRPRPTAYVIPKNLPLEDEILRVVSNHDIPYYTIPKRSSALLSQYIKTEDGVDVTAELEVFFENGAYVFPNTVPSTILSVIMEPDFNTASGRKMSLLSMGLIKSDDEARLPVYRYCHDLNDGKIKFF